MNIDVFYLRVMCTCDQCDSQFCGLQLTALIKPNLFVLLYCCACLQDRNQEGRRGAKPPKKNFFSPWKNMLYLV